VVEPAAVVSESESSSPQAAIATEAAIAARAIAAILRRAGRREVIPVSFTLALMSERSAGESGELPVVRRRRRWGLPRAIPETGGRVVPGVDPSDEALLAGYAGGDRASAAAFVRRFQGRVYGLALTIVRDPAVAEEVAQETFARVWHHGGAYDARRGRVATWLLSIARNLAIDVIRTRRSQPADPELVAAELSLEAPTPAADDVDLQPDEREQLREAIAELPPDQRRALVLAAYLGRTAREISELDGLPVGTVKTRIRTAMLKLRARLEAER
jgi:RNA polymerase sigma factor (sigma-70 family)